MSQGCAGFYFESFCLQEIANNLARLSIDALARLGGYLSTWIIVVLKSCVVLGTTLLVVVLNQKRNEMNPVVLRGKRILPENFYCWLCWIAHTLLRQRQTSIRAFVKLVNQMELPLTLSFVGLLQVRTQLSRPHANTLKCNFYSCILLAFLGHEILFAFWDAV